MTDARSAKCRVTEQLQGTQMGQVHADFQLTNVFNERTVAIRALIDTGATNVFVTAEVARALGVDPEELSQANVTLADGRRVPVPCLPPLEIRFGCRRYYGTAYVMGEECLVGVIPLEAMDLVIDLKSQTLGVNPAYPDAPFLRVPHSALLQLLAPQLGRR